EWHVGVDPIGQFGVLRPGEGSEHAVGIVSVALGVVAAHHGERGRAAFATAAQRLDHVAEVSAGGGSGFEIGAHGGVVEVELAGDLVDVVSALGDGQGDDADGRVAHALQGRFGVVGGVEVVHDRADHARFELPVGVFDREGV